MSSLKDGWNTSRRTWYTTIITIIINISHKWLVSQNKTRTAVWQFNGQCIKVFATRRNPNCFPGLGKRRKHVLSSSISTKQKELAHTNSVQRFGSGMMNGNSSEGCMFSDSMKWSIASLKCKSNSIRNPTCAWTNESISFVISLSFSSSSTKEMASLKLFFLSRSFICSSPETFQ